MVYTQKELEEIPRAELQTICKVTLHLAGNILTLKALNRKGYGFKANEGTAKIIANILASDAEQQKYNECVVLFSSRVVFESMVDKRKWG